MGDLVDAREHLNELAPVLRRAITLDPASVARLRGDEYTVSVLVTLPFNVLVARTIAASAAAWDVTVPAADLLDWLDGDRPEPPAGDDARWRRGLPPSGGWRRVESVPDDVIRGLVRSGALALKDAAAREGVPGAQPRAEVADALLDSVVLTVTADDDPTLTAQVTLRVLSALTRMGFLARGSHANIDRSGRWVRVAASYGSVFLEGPGGLALA